MSQQPTNQWIQREVRLEPRTRGFHLITDEVVKKVPEISQIARGICHVFIQHTSASLTINENADPDVRADFESFVRRLVPEDMSLYRHTVEGPDDMTSHIKASWFGSSVTVPICDGRLALGTWQGLFLGEHRERGGSRRLMITIHGESV